MQLQKSKLIMSDVKDKKLFLLDMDGTIYLGNQLFDGCLDFLDYVKSIGGRYMFLTNNSSKSAGSCFFVHTTREPFLLNGKSRSFDN